MVHLCCESFSDSARLCECCNQLLRFFEAARLSEVEGRGSILTYGFISAYASRMMLTAEVRRDILARTQWEQTTAEAGGDLQGWESVR